MKVTVDSMYEAALGRGMAFLGSFALAGFGLVSFLPQILRVGSQAVTIPYRAVVLGASLAILPVLLRYRRIRPSAGLALFALFWAVYSVRLVADTLVFPVPLARPPEVYLQFAFGVCLVPSLPFFARRDEGGWDRFLACLWFLLLAVTCLSLLVDLPTEGKDMVRMSGNETENPISLGRTGGALAVLCAYRLVGRDEGGAVRRILYLFALLAGMAVAFFSGSRGPILGAAASTLMPFSFSLARGRWKAIAGVIAALVLAAPLLVKVTTEQGGALVERFVYLSDADNVKADARPEMWREGWRQFLEDPWTGRSIDVAHGEGYPHNVPIEAFMSTGIVGGALFLSILAYGTCRSLLLLVRRSGGEWLGLLFVMYAVGAMFSGAIYTSFEFWYLFGAVAAPRS